MKKEIWLPIPGFVDYEASSWGRIRSWINNKRNRRSYPKLITPSFNTSGYLGVCLSMDKMAVSKNVHRIIAITFLGTPPDKNSLVLHKDDDRCNNFVSNLYYGNQKQNMDDRRKNGKSGKILTEQNVKKIRQLKKLESISNENIAKKFKVSRRTIDRVISNRIWKEEFNPVFES